eukprot:504688-Rhodomonas_salina.3
MHRQTDRSINRAGTWLGNTDYRVLGGVRSDPSKHVHSTLGRGANGPERKFPCSTLAPGQARVLDATQVSERSDLARERALGMQRELWKQERCELGSCQVT